MIYLPDDVRDRVAPALEGEAIEESLETPLDLAGEPGRTFLLCTARRLVAASESYAPLNWTCDVVERRDVAEARVTDEGGGRVALTLRGAAGPLLRVLSSSLDRGRFEDLGRSLREPARAPSPRAPATVEAPPERGPGAVEAPPARELRRTGDADGARAAVRVELEREIARAGESIAGRAVFDWPVARKVIGLDLVVEGAERTKIAVSSGHATHVFREESAQLRHRWLLFGEQPGGVAARMAVVASNLVGAHPLESLPPGRYECPFVVMVPQGALPTYAGKNATVEYFVEARIVRGGGVERSRVPLRVGGEAVAIEGGRATALPGRRLLAWVTPRIGIEVDVERCEARPGATLRGTLRLDDRSGREVNGVVLTLESFEIAHARRQTRRSVSRRLRSRIDAGGGAGSIPFTIEVPGSFPWAYRGAHSRVDWRLHVRLDVPFAPDPRVRFALTEGPPA